MFSKEPEATKDYAVDWTPWLAGDTLAASSWTVFPEGELAVVQDGQRDPSFTATGTRVWLTGGTNGSRYAVENHVTTAGGRTEVHEFLVAVVE